MGWERTGSALLFLYCQHLVLQISQILANTNCEIVEFFSLSQETRVCGGLAVSQLDVWYDKAWEPTTRVKL